MGLSRPSAGRVWIDLSCFSRNVSWAPSYWAHDRPVVLMIQVIDVMALTLNRGCSENLLNWKVLNLHLVTYNASSTLLKKLYPIYLGSTLRVLIFINSI